jgi:hypothetical protein
MVKKSIRVVGFYRGIGQIQIGCNQAIRWESICGNHKPPSIPFGTRIDIELSYNDHDFMSGKDGVVWATYNLQQAEMIRDTLFIQMIPSYIEEIGLDDFQLFQIVVQDRSQVSQAMDFIWRSNDGLRLQPDWVYPDGEANDSFEKWMNGNVV